MKERVSRQPPRDGGFVCKGPHRAAECPTATNEQKEEARRVLAAHRAGRLKHIDTGAYGGGAVCTRQICGAGCVGASKDGEEEELLLGRSTMKDIGIDVNSLLEILAGGIDVADADRDDVTADDSELGFNDDKPEVHVIVAKLVDEAVEAGFEPTLADDLRTLVHEYEDVWPPWPGEGPVLCYRSEEARYEGWGPDDAVLKVSRP
ncbi:hypothetical protein PC128_g20219 [Phytophthora cactorum]|nr:hypothetical protein PC128_g20219 [Phytophthora cactorum]